MAPYANVPTKPTNSSNALSERFIVFLLRVIRDFPGDGKPLRMCIIQPVRPKLGVGGKSPRVQDTCFERSRLMQFVRPV